VKRRSVTVAASRVASTLRLLYTFLHLAESAWEPVCELFCAHSFTCLPSFWPQLALRLGG